MAADVAPTPVLPRGRGGRRAVHPPIRCAGAGCEVVFRGSTAQRAAAADGRPVYHSRECQKASSVVTRPCRVCGVDVVRPAAEARRTEVVYCSPEHVIEGRRLPRGPYSNRKGRVDPCPICGTGVYRRPAQIRRGTGIYCGRGCMREGLRRAQSVPVGSRRIDKSGYAAVKVAEPDVWRAEHRYVVEQALGRRLLTEEEVHHLNGDPQDNRVVGPFVLTAEGRLRSGNLELWSTSQPKGQEIGPKVEFAYRLLALYGTPEQRAEFAAYLPVEALPAERDGG